MGFTGNISESKWNFPATNHGVLRSAQGHVVCNFNYMEFVRSKIEKSETDSKSD